MGYNLYVIRKEHWHDEDQQNDIPPREWLDYINSDQELVADVSDIMLEELEENGDLLGATYNIGEQYQGYLYYSDGAITSKNPNTTTVAKMLVIATKLNAKVQGDEGEYYDEAYLREASKPWWKFW